MKLIYAPASPFARKVRVLANETSLLQKIELLETAVLPVTFNAQVNAINPLGKVPVLLTDDSQIICDSRVICEYLDTLHDNPRLLPSEGALRWRILSLASLADGLMDAALLVRYEQTVRPSAQQWDAWIEGQLGKVQRTLVVLEEHATDLQGKLDIAQISVACALGYLDFRFPELEWRRSAPELEKFQASFSLRNSMLATVPG